MGACLARCAQRCNGTGEGGRLRLCCAHDEEEGCAVVLTTLADGLLNTAQGIYDTGADMIGTPTIRLGVTGLARSGKTVFITSLVANLLDRGRMPGLLAAAEGRIEAVFLQPQPDDTLPRFEYERHLAALTGQTPHCP